MTTTAEYEAEIARLHRALGEQTEMVRRWRNRARSFQRKASARSRRIAVVIEDADRLRGVIESARGELLDEHQEDVGIRWGRRCRVCGGDWPCASRLIADELRDDVRTGPHGAVTGVLSLVTLPDCTCGHEALDEIVPWTNFHLGWACPRYSLLGALDRLFGLISGAEP